MESRNLTLFSYLCLAIASACGGSATSVGAPGAADYRRTLTDVEIVGNEALSDKAIEKGLVNRGPHGFLRMKRAKFNPGELVKDAERIVGVYRQHGYFDMAVDDIDIQRDDRNKALLKFVIDEGKPVLLNEVTITWKGEPEGSGADTSRELRSKIRDEALLQECCKDNTRHGDVLHYPDYVKARARLVGFFARQGYAFAEVTGHVEVNRQLKQADVRFVVDPGPLVKLGKPIIMGLGRTPKQVVRDRIAWQPGETYDPDLLATTRGRLLQLKSISSVDIDLVDTDRSENADVAIRIYENMQREVRLGGGAAFDAVHWETRARAEYTKNGIFFDPRTNFRAQVQPAIRWLRANPDSKPSFGGQARVDIERIDMFAPLVTGQAMANYTLERLESYSVLGPEVRLGANRPFFNEWLQVGAFWTLDRYTFPSVNPAITADVAFAEAVGITEPYRLAWFGQTVAVDRRDNAVKPRRGFYLSLGFEEAGPFAGSRFDAVTADADARVYYTPIKRLTLGAHARHSRLLTAGTTLPITRRYYAGGATSQRGFSQRRLSPTLTTPNAAGTGVDTAYVGGDARVETSVEARLDLLPFMDDWFGVVGFLDGADVSMFRNDLDFTDLHWAAGVGLRLGTPVGPIRFDAGFRLNRYGPGEPDPNSRFAIHLSLGEAF